MQSRRFWNCANYLHWCLQANIYVYRLVHNEVGAADVDVQKLEYRKAKVSTGL